MTRILLVGSGMTSAVAGSLLRKKLPKAELVIWDKSRGAGGRMTTFRNSEDPFSTFDLGAQYITATPDYAKVHSSYYTELKAVQILAKMTAKIGGTKMNPEGTEQFISPNGSSSIVKYYLNKAPAVIKFGFWVQNIRSKGKKWEVSTMTGESEYFDVVVLTMPVPQILGLSGQIKEIIESNSSLLEQLNSVEYSSRFALGLFYDKGSKIALSDGSSAQYVTNNPAIRFIAIDNMKRGRDDGYPSVIVHTSVPFGKANLEKSVAVMKPILLGKLKEMYPEWPEPQFVKCHKWRYSQVSSAFPGLPGAVKIGEGLIAGGDGFTHSNMDGCIESAQAVVEQVLQYVCASE